MLHRFEHESTMDDIKARLEQLQAELARLPIEHAREMARLDQVIAGAEASYRQAEAEFTQQAAEAARLAQQHMADVLAAAAPNRPVGEPPTSFYPSSTELAQQLQHLQATAPPLEEVRRSVQTAQTLLSTRDTLVAKLGELGSRPARELTPAQAVEAEHRWLV
jgi:DNA repair exonuclease SbcCD ATPase subunit